MSSTEAFDLIRRVSGILSDAGLAMDGEPDCSGNLVRCGTMKRPHGMDGAYAVHLDKTPLVWLCNWHDGGLPQTVYLYEKNQLDALTEAEREALRERIRQEKEENARRLAERRRKAAETAKRIFRLSLMPEKKTPICAARAFFPWGICARHRTGGWCFPC